MQTSCLNQRTNGRFMLAIIGSIIISLQVFASTSDQSDLSLENNPVPGKMQMQAFKQINYILNKYHYHTLNINDNLSAQILDKFINQLDPNHSFFLRQDIKHFNKNKFLFDDYIQDEKLEPAYAIFHVFKKRVEQRTAIIIKTLQQSFDFEKDEVMLLDRSEAKWAANVGELNNIWRKRIKNDILVLRLAKTPAEKIKKILRSRYTYFARQTQQINASDVFRLFINAFMTSIEPHTSFFTPRASENFKIHMRLSLEGIGAVLGLDNEYTQVRQIISGGPAKLDGSLKSGDRIIGVGQSERDIVDVIGWRLDDVVDLIRGPKGAVVRLQVLPKETGLEGPSKVIAIKRDKIKLEEQAASKHIIQANTQYGTSRIGVIDLPSFYVDFEGQRNNSPNYRSTTRDVAKLLTSLKTENIDGLVIDLRGNGGGSLTEAVTLTGLFIRTGPVVQVRNSRGKIQINRDPNPKIAYDGPLIVLVDRYSASASEIFASAIQDYHRGLVVGEPTFGKGTVQDMITLRQASRGNVSLGQIKLTIAQFFRINGDSTQQRGVIPDIIWPTISSDVDVGERTYKNALPWKHIDEIYFKPWQDSPLPSLFSHTLESHIERIKQDPEFQYMIDLHKLRKKRLDMKTVSLHQQKRILEREIFDQERLRIENKKRASLNEEILTSVDEIDKQDKKIDIFLRESSRILNDYIKMAQNISNSSRGFAKQLLLKTQPNTSP